MANTKLIRRCIFFLLAVSFVLSDRFVDGGRIGNMESKELIRHKGTVKTIEVIMNIMSFLILILFFFSLAIYFLEKFLACLSMV